MAEPQTSSCSDPAVENPATPSAAAAAAPAQASTTTTQQRASRPPRGPPLHQVYKQPVPLRTFPFPVTDLSNPLSLVRLAVVWLSHAFFPPPSEPSVTHTAFWDQETRTIVVTDEKSMADLWQQGFYGKGSLSRSEPNWLKREKNRLGALNGRVSEQNTDKRREDRIRAKWERARAEQEAIEQKRLDEARAAAEAKVKAEKEQAIVLPPPCADVIDTWAAPVGPLELLRLPNSQANFVPLPRANDKGSDDFVDATDTSAEDSGSSGNDDAESTTTLSTTATHLIRPKSVRFSPKVQSTVFQRTDPPSPPRSVSASSLKEDAEVNANGPAPVEQPLPSVDTIKASAKDATEPVLPVEVAVVNKEHLQLAPEEALFLVFALGVLKVVDTATQQTLSTRELLALLRQNSYFPPRELHLLQPDDPFLIHYAVYHHFRSIGWVPRPGIKFGVDCKFFFPLLVAMISFDRGYICQKEMSKC